MPQTNANRDKPRINLAFSTLDQEETPEPFVYMTKTNHRIVFPDIFDMEAEEGERFMMEVEKMGYDSAFISKWLSTEDYEELKKDKLTLRQRMRLFSAVMSYYEGSLGTSGEGPSSKN